MLKFRLSVAFATVVVLGLATQVVVFASPQQPDNPSDKSLQTTKKKKKKRKMWRQFLASSRRSK
jgi:hypothetical protein